MANRNSGDTADLPVAPFPRTTEEFDGDSRISFSKLDNKYILENDDGSEWEFDTNLNRWIPSLDEALLAQQQEAYRVEGVDETEAAGPQKKRKAPVTNDDSANYPGAPKPKKVKPEKPQAERKNTAIYVTSLPLTVTVSEVKDFFSRAGLIAEEIDTGKPRIKLYSDDSGAFKGDALIVFFRPESVSLAITLFDESDFRHGESGPSGKMTVREADFSYKKVKEPGNEGGEKKQGMTKDRKKIIKKTQKLNNKLADWDDDDPSALPDTSSRWDKVVVLKHMFTLAELADDPAALLDIKEDVRSESAKLGEVTNVVLFDKEADGVMTVRFGTTEAANACVRLFDGRSFAGQKVEAYIADGSEKFKKTSAKKAAEALDDEEQEEKGEAKRLDEFGAWLEEEPQMRGTGV